MKGKVSKKESVVEEQEATFTKNQIINSKKYKSNVDLLSFKLKEDIQYSLNEVDEIIENFKKGKV